MVDRSFGWLVDQLVGRLVDWLVWVVGWLADRLVGQLVGWSDRWMDGYWLGGWILEGDWVDGWMVGQLVSGLVHLCQKVCGANANVTELFPFQNLK